jgi:hypothetical protein
VLVGVENASAEISPLKSDCDIRYRANEPITKQAQLTHRSTPTITITKIRELESFIQGFLVILPEFLFT